MKDLKKKYTKESSIKMEESEIMQDEDATFNFFLEGNPIDALEQYKKKTKGDMERLIKFMRE